ncbi:homeobox protein Hox-C13a [Heptranchias perlo]|uniref:homeobox protein Hox-C13a n=1 Tax=Heptranchias perlo TaxID=212740 RepID=UPI00355A4B0C
MTASVVLRPHWADTLMYVCDKGPEEINRNSVMEGLNGTCSTSHCKEFFTHPALGRHTGSVPHQGPVFSDLPAAEGGRQCPPAAHQTASPGASLGYGYPFGSPYYGCKLPYPHGVNLPQSALKPYEKYSEVTSGLPNSAAAGEELSSTRVKEFAFYPSFAGTYQTVPGYLDVSVVPGISAHNETRHEPLIPMDGYQHWSLPNNWDGQVYCAKEHSQPCQIWKSPFPDIVPLQPEGGSYRRGRKKRVPYTKLQLKELEREYTASKFITKEKRRKISNGTNLSERQVTIWFQNRRVKEKKVDGKSKPAHHHTA